LITKFDYTQTPTDRRSRVHNQPHGWQLITNCIIRGLHVPELVMSRCQIFNIELEISIRYFASK